MNEYEDKIAALQTRLENLVRTQIGFQQEITNIRRELDRLRQFRPVPVTPPAAPETASPAAVPPPIAAGPPPPRPVPPADFRQPSETRPFPNARPPLSDYSRTARESSGPFRPESPPAEKSEIEKFIGENLISKIGIVVLVIGVAIGAKYAIDNNLISPLTRIVLGYLFGFGLLGLAVWLKSKYLNFSAVLLSGAMAILYFITFFGYSLYQLFPQSAAFALMTFFTVFTVAAAINYARQIIAHLGLVGAYAIPFMLSDGSGNYAFLFAYITIINLGILAVSLKKYWKPLFYTSFFFTWAIFGAWYFSAYRTPEHFGLGFGYLTVFFLIFHLTFMGYKLLSVENLAAENISLILSNSFIYYGLGYSLFRNHPGLEQYLGLLTVANAGLHFVFALVISRLKRFPDDLVYLMTALVITFATIAVPVQMDGHRVTLVWATEAAVLFWFGRRKALPLFEYFSLPLMALAFGSLVHDWAMVENYRTLEVIATIPRPFWNGFFRTCLYVAAAFGFIYYVNRGPNSESDAGESSRVPLGYLVGAVALFVFYNAFRIEIGNYFDYLTALTAVRLPAGDYYQSYPAFDADLGYFKLLWQLNYTMLFLAALSFVNIKYFRDEYLGYLNLALNALATLFFITGGLYLLSELRADYLLRIDGDSFARGPFNIAIRYICYGCFALLMLATYLYRRQEQNDDGIGEKALEFLFDTLFFGAVWVLASSELLNLMDIYQYADSYKLGLSILWGVYALLLIVIGIYRHKTHLRIGAIGLFALTLAKVFFYDIAELSTIAKTVVFVSLGILLLIVSFLYTKYKSFIFGEEIKED
ncbi:MAG: DUF2339 domain-containing protein [Acidobacteria bacterium]|nr:DUF2339 domain-containing protein [Acidobacteriota bacterium]